MDQKYHERLHKLEATYSAVQLLSAELKSFAWYL